MSNLTQIQPILDRFKNAAKEIYGDRLVKVLLYGSYARGEQHDESDIDLMVVLKDEGFDKGKDKEQLFELMTDMSIDYKKWVSPRVVPYSRWYESNVPFFYFVRKDQVEI